MLPAIAMTGIAVLLAAWMLATFLAFRIRKLGPEAGRSVGEPGYFEWWPFWLLHYWNGRKLQALPEPLRPVAFVAALLFSIGLAAIVCLVTMMLAEAGPQHA